MKEIRISKAQPIRGMIESVIIIIDEEIKESTTVERWRRETETEGIYLANALSGTLPGAVLDAMLAVPQIVE